MEDQKAIYDKLNRIFRVTEPCMWRRRSPFRRRHVMRRISGSGDFYDFENRRLECKYASFVRENLPRPRLHRVLKSPVQRLKASRRPLMRLLGPIQSKRFGRYFTAYVRLDALPPGFRQPLHLPKRHPENIRYPRRYPRKRQVCGEYILRH